MKPPPVSYHGPEMIDEAMEMLAEFGSEAKVLAGGQSLVPMLNMRLTSPARLIDVNGLTELAYVRTTADGVRVGALARHADLERDERAHAAIPLLRQAVRSVAHPTIRNRGTTVGSLVHADPSGEMTAVLALLGGSVTLTSKARGRREVPAAEFFVGPMESATEPDELAVEAWFPASS
jgi:carbon-monoxide dehydrogenase medium subunit